MHRISLLLSILGIFILLALYFLIPAQTITGQITHVSQVKKDIYKLEMYNQTIYFKPNGNKNMINLVNRTVSIHISSSESQFPDYIYVKKIIYNQKK